jgi:TatA/E family protein of Tat protein translocase
MFGIGMQELAIIFVVALLIFGPKRLPELARTLGKGMAEFRRASNDLRQSFSLDDPPSHPPPTAPSRRTDIPPDPRQQRDLDSQPPQAIDAPPAPPPPSATNLAEDGAHGVESGQAPSAETGEAAKKPEPTSE